ncbi:membrane fusion protein, cobalt-zinc-cadmium efflux system [Pustulibacterium marinum]|uniref:Membrane fusion protein, cobalt-zinc-cadmium efflux system n=1 Tax=Pustulibacterium marinum TaxID=1224947 RepID=A0A1I7HUD5_9FLAO|nr:efflux RND transporter periplasmic adaptor subunit [Pustulibacterium marinum]SFU64096.1 membrane fusion protein, cobalt-zinc-cadmium efflux system [Pustulibacterium marinum]
MKKYIGLIIGVLLTSVGCQEQETPSKESTGVTEQETLPKTIHLAKEQMQNAALRIGTAQVTELNEVVILQGLVTVPPQNKIDVSFPLQGYIKETQVMAGMHVTKGQVLATIEGMELLQLQQDYLTAKEKFQLAVQEYNRQKELNVNKATSDKLFEQISTERETEHILMTALAQKLALVGITAESLSANTIHNSVALRAPVNGLVAMVGVNTGKYISSTEKLFEIIAMKETVVVFDAFEKDVPNVRVGQSLEVYSNGATEEHYEGVIKYINHSLNADHAAEVTAVISGSTEVFYPGLFVNGEIHIENHSGLTVPSEAVVQWRGDSYVFKEIGAQDFEMVKVEAGISQHGQQQITASGINQQTKLVIKNAYTLLMKAMNSGEE